MFDNLHTYENILVSGVAYDFSQNPHENIPYRLYADWAALVIKFAQTVNPAFIIPSFPESLEFETEVIPSDLPYPADENYYNLDYIFFELKSENEYGLSINFENGRQGGGNPVSIETTGFNRGVSSYIFKDSTSPTARFFIWHDAELSLPIEKIIAHHTQYCLANT